jgi:hypothetical protein
VNGEQPLLRAVRAGYGLVSYSALPVCNIAPQTLFLRHCVVKRVCCRITTPQS